MYHLHEDKRVKQSAEQICSALNEILQDSEIGDISVTALAQKANVSKATFYRSFDCIDDVLALQTDRAVADMIKYIFAYKNEAHTLPPGEGLFFEAFFRFWFTHSSVVEQLIKTRKTFLLLAAFSESLHKHASFFRHRLDIDDETLKYFITVRASGLTSCLVCWIKDGKTTHPDKMPEVMMRVMQPAKPICNQDKSIHKEDKE